MKIIPLSEGAFSVDKSKVFHPFDKEQDNIQDRSTGSILVEIQPFVVITSNDVILLDTGLGHTLKDGALQIHHNLMDNGINPMEVTKVLMSHLHKDHAGGLFKEDRILGHRFPSFPNATYYVNENEFYYALEKGFPSYTTPEFDGLKEYEKTTFIKGSENISEEIYYEECGAHTPYHQFFRITDGSDVAFFGGDVAPQYKQMLNRFVAKYDYDGKRCMELRQQWWDEGKEAGWTFLFYHDIAMPVFRP